MPLGVGVKLPVEYTPFEETICVSNPPNMKMWSFQSGPPIVALGNMLLKRGGLVSPSKNFCVLLRLLSAELPSVAETVPCQLLLPDLVMMLTTEPELRPYSAPN